VFWVISVYFNIRNILPKFCPFLLGHPVYIYDISSLRVNGRFDDEKGWHKICDLQEELKDDPQFLI
jgi:hypothetical protein